MRNGADAEDLMHMRRTADRLFGNDYLWSILAAGRLGWLDADRAMTEALLSIRRAGADMIVTYWAREFGRMKASEG
jgi:delta-aminolevulinic acid dehydratase/porphobilinogen synthase